MAVCPALTIEGPVIAGCGTGLIVTSKVPELEIQPSVLVSTTVTVPCVQLLFHLMMMQAESGQHTIVPPTTTHS
jgi:hypothetical protein